MMSLLRLIRMFRPALPGVPGLVLGLVALNAGAAEYAVVELAPVAGDRESGANAINESGMAVGISSNREGQPQAVRWDADGDAEVLIPGAVRTYSGAHAINDHGEMAGYFFTAGAVRACRWEAGLVMQDLGALLSDPVSEALDINNDGLVAGFSRPLTGFPQGWTWHPDRGVETLAISGAFSTRIFSLNQHGALAASGLGSSVQQGALQRDGLLEMLPNLPSGQFGQAQGLNNAGQAVGFSDLSGGQEIACRWENGVATSIGHLGGGQSQARAINNFGQVVGTSLIDSDNVAEQVPEGWGQEILFQGDTSVEEDVVVDHDRARAFLWDGTAMVDLNTRIPADSGWLLLGATDINDRGQIVGQGLRRGRLKGFRLDPVTPPAPQVAVTLPQPDARLPQGGAFAVQVDTNHPAGTARVYLNGELQASGPPGRLTFQPGTLAFGNHTLRVETLDSGGALQASREVTVTVRDLTLAEWKLRHLGAESGPGTGDDDDPDLDGLGNRREFAFNLPPDQPASRVPFTIDFEGGQPHLTFKRRKAFADQGLDYVLRSAADLTGWTDLTGDLELESRTSDGDADPLETVRFRYQGPQPQRLFFQVEVR